MTKLIKLNKKSPKIKLDDGTKLPYPSYRIQFQDDPDIVVSPEQMEMLAELLIPLSVQSPEFLAIIQDMNGAADVIIQRALSSLLNIGQLEKRGDLILFSAMANKMTLIPTWWVSSAGVTFRADSLVLMYNPAFMFGENVLFRMGIVIHEAMHILNEHLILYDPRSNFVNLATDMEINQNEYI